MTEPKASEDGSVPTLCVGPQQAPMWQRLQSRHPFPLDITFSLTDRCPLRCEHCYLDPQLSGEELSFEEITRVLEQLADAGVLRLAFTGGEPALRDDLPDIIRVASRLHFAVSLKTSAFPLDREATIGLRRAGLGELNVSLYHTSARDHDRFTGMKGSWEKATGALEVFQEAGGLARVSVVAMGWNANVIESLVKMCSRRGWTVIVDPRLTMRKDGDLLPLRYMIEDEAVLSMVLRATGKELSPIPPRKATDPVCSVGRGGAYIRADGDVHACTNFPLSFGNLRQKSFKDLWLESKERQWVTTITWGQSAKCMTCEDAIYCERCPGEAYLAHKDVDRPVRSDCIIARARKRVSQG